MKKKILIVAANFYEDIANSLISSAKYELKNESKIRFPRKEQRSLPKGKSYSYRKQSLFEIDQRIIS